MQAVTELDVTTGTPVTQAKLIEQGYYYRDAFRIFRAHADDLFSVTVWGLTDGRSWRSDRRAARLRRRAAGQAGLLRRRRRRPAGPAAHGERLRRRRALDARDLRVRVEAAAAATSSRTRPPSSCAGRRTT